MTFIEWFIFFLVIQVIHFAGTWKLYLRANRKAWEAAIPIYNAVILMKIINRPKWWVILLFIPVINQLMFPIVWIETARSFGFNKRKDTALVLLTLGFYLFFINYATNSTYKLNRSLKPRTALGEWISSIDLENAAVGHPEVAEACVVGIPHPKWDERPMLFIVSNNGEPIDKQSILDFLASKVAKWWLPDEIIFLEELPHGATGKLLKVELREQYKEHLME